MSSWVINTIGGLIGVKHESISEFIKIATKKFHEIKGQSIGKIGRLINNIIGTSTHSSRQETTRLKDIVDINNELLVIKDRTIRHGALGNSDIRRVAYLLKQKDKLQNVFRPINYLQGAHEWVKRSLHSRYRTDLDQQYGTRTNRASVDSSTKHAGTNNPYQNLSENFTGKALHDLRNDLMKNLHEENARLNRMKIQFYESGRWNPEDDRALKELKTRRKQLTIALDQLKEYEALETFVQTPSSIRKIEINNSNTHILQWNAFADTFGKTCPQCRRKMKLQWARSLATVESRQFFWGAPAGT